MTELQQTQDNTPSDDIAVVKAIAVLADAARRDFPALAAQLKAAGFGITGYEPSQEKPGTEAASDIGALIEGRGIYHGTWKAVPNGVTVYAYSDTDFLKDASGEQMLLTWYGARDELARRNGGRRYGDGTEAALGDALVEPGTEGVYKDGDLVMAPLVLLNGVDRDGKKSRAANTFALLRGSKGDAFKSISNTLRNSSGFARWSWSCSELRDYSSHVLAVSLSAGLVDWNHKVFYRLGVLPFRIFREPHAVKAVSHLGI